MSSALGIFGPNSRLGLPGMIPVEDILRRGFPGPWRGTPGWGIDSFNVNSRRDKDDMILTFDVPGVDKDNIKLTVDKRTVTVETVRVLEGDRLTSDTSLTLPVSIRPENDVVAHLDSGVLTVKISGLFSGANQNSERIIEIVANSTASGENHSISASSDQTSESENSEEKEDN